MIKSIQRAMYYSTLRGWACLVKCEFFAYLYVPAQTDAFTDQLAADFCFSLLSNSLFVVK